MIELIFAWSSDGHDRLTVLAITAAIGQLIKLGKSDLMKRFLRLDLDFNEMSGQNTSSLSRAKRNLYNDVDRDPAPSEVQVQRVLSLRLKALPRIVQQTDVHLGNFPYWGWGESFDSNGQVRHFMRSTANTSEVQAHGASMDWIKNHLDLAFQKMRSALFVNYEWTQVFSSNA